MILQVLALLVLSAALLYRLALRRAAFWKRRGIPGPEMTPIKGNIDQVFGKKPAVLQLQKWSREYGKVYGIQEGWFNVLVTSDAEMVCELLVDKFEYFHGRLLSPINGDLDTVKHMNLFVAQGKRWKRLRAIANPAFSISNLKKVMPIIDDSIGVSMALLEEARQKGKPVNLHTYFTEMTLDAIARIAMGQLESKQFHSEYSQVVQECFHHVGNNIYDYAAMLFPWLGRNVIRPVLLNVGRLIGDPFSIIEDKFTEAVRERKQQREVKLARGIDEEEDEMKKRVDFIDLFLDSESNECRLTGQQGTFNKLEKFERKQLMEEIVQNCVVFLLAGFDTTANTLSMVCHYLALHPEAQTKLWEEIEAICPEGEPTYEQLNQLKYAEAVVKETLRLCPIGAAVVNRVCAETTTLGPYTVEKGTAVKADILTLHRDKQLWGPDADEFRPERWLGEGPMPSAYYPFGGGPRICIGMRLAMLEEKMALAHLLRRFQLKRCPETRTELEFTGQIVLNPQSIIVQIEPRRLAD